MADYIVGARFEVKNNQLVAAATVNREALEKLAEAAKKADAALYPVIEDGPIQWKRMETGIKSASAAVTESGRQFTTLGKTQVEVGQAITRNTVALAGMAGGFAASTAGAVAERLATELLTAALDEAKRAIDGNVRVHELLADVEVKATVAREALKRSSGELRAAYVAETEALVLLLRQARELSTIQRGIRLLPGGGIILDLKQAAANASGRTAEDQRRAENILRYTREPYDDAIIRRSQTDENAREAERKRLDGEFKKRFLPTGSARGGLSDEEREAERLEQAWGRASKALDEYGRASQDIIEKAQAELSGRRDLIAQIEIEAHARKQAGTEFVEKNRERIAALAKERAESQRVADQYRATAQFIESSYTHLGNVLDATLVLSWDRSEDAIKNWENTMLSSLRSVLAELQRLAIVNPLINAIAGNNRLPTAYGQGGLINSVLGLFGLGSGTGAGMIDPSAVRHQGGYVDASGPMRRVPAAAFADAPRAHDGLHLAPNERPVIAQEGEAIFTPRQMDNADRIMRRAMARSDQPAQVNVTVIDQRAKGEAIEVRRRRGAGGSVNIDVIVKDAVKRAFNEGGLDSTIERNFGIPRRGRGG